MTELDKVHRIAQLTLSCIANIACYRAGWNGEVSPPVLRNKVDFWVRANGNFLDVATLNWCILFAEEQKGKHDWKKAFLTKTDLDSNLYHSLKTNKEEFQQNLDDVKTYRDKYLAHLDNPSLIFYPKTEFLLSSASYLFKLLKSHNETKGFLIGIYEDADVHYDEKYTEALGFIL